MHFEHDKSKIYATLAKLLEEGQPAVLVTCVEKEGFGPAEKGGVMLVSADALWGTVGGGGIENVAIEKARKMLGTAQTALVPYILNEKGVPQEGQQKLNMLCGGAATLFFESFPASERLFVFGAGHVGAALCDKMKGLGFCVTVIDDREGFAKAVESADRYIEGGFADLPQNELKGAWFVVTTHSHDIDYRIMKDIIQSGAEYKYLGVISSKSKVTTILSRLKDELGTGFDLSRLYMPIGLDLGGKAPADIGLSIAAQLQALRYGKEALHLSTVKK